MAILTSQSLNLPDNLVSGLIQYVQTGSAVASLSAQKPVLFGNSDLIVFNKVPKAEFVEEGAQKNPADAGFTTVKVTPHKAQVTMRFDQEVQWADQSRQLGVLSALTDTGSRALARALDLGLLYAINPATGTKVPSWTNYLNSTTNRVQGGGDQTIDDDLNKAIGKVLTDGRGIQANGLAITPSAAFALASAKDKQGRPLYPELGFGTSMTSFKGITSSVTDTVAAPEASTKPNVEAIVGDWQNGIYWGIQNSLPVDLIQYGDPDGQGDLKRQNQIALRLEIVFAWYVDPTRFAVVDAPSAAGSTTSRSGK